MEEFRDHDGDWLLKRIKRKGRDRYIYSAPKILEHFKGFDFGNKRGQEIRTARRSSCSGSTPIPSTPTFSPVPTAPW